MPTTKKRWRAEGAGNSLDVNRICDAVVPATIVPRSLMLSALYALLLPVEAELWLLITISSPVAGAAASGISTSNRSSAAAKSSLSPGVSAR